MLNSTNDLIYKYENNTCNQSQCFSFDRKRAFSCLNGFCSYLSQEDVLIMHFTTIHLSQKRIYLNCCISLSGLPNNLQRHVMLLDIPLLNSFKARLYLSHKICCHLQSTHQFRLHMCLFLQALLLLHSSLQCSSCTLGFSQHYTAEPLPGSFQGQICYEYLKLVLPPFSTSYTIPATLEQRM